MDIDDHQGRGQTVEGKLHGAAKCSGGVLDLRGGGHVTFPHDGRFDLALETIEEEAGSKDRLLYYLERGLILHYADRHAESNEAFAAAERTARRIRW